MTYSVCVVETLDGGKKKGKMMMVMLFLLFLVYCRVAITYVAGNKKETKIVFLLQNALKSPIFAVFEGQVSDKRSANSFYSDHRDRALHHCGDWEPAMQIHCPNPKSRGAADAAPASSNLAVLSVCFYSVLMRDEKIEVMRSLRKNKNSKLNKCRKVILFVAPTICMCVCVCAITGHQKDYFIRQSKREICPWLSS